MTIQDNQEDERGLIQALFDSWKEVEPRQDKKKWIIFNKVMDLAVYFEDYPFEVVKWGFKKLNSLSEGWKSQ